MVATAVGAFTALPEPDAVTTVDELAAPPAPEAGLLLFELGGTGFIDRDFTTNTPWRPAKPARTSMSYIRHMIHLTDQGCKPTLPAQALRSECSKLQYDVGL